MKCSAELLWRLIRGRSAAAPHQRLVGRAMRAAATNAPAAPVFFYLQSARELAACKTLANEQAGLPREEAVRRPYQRRVAPGGGAAHAPRSPVSNQRCCLWRTLNKRCVPSPCKKREVGCPARPRESVKRCPGSTGAPVAVTPKSFHSPESGARLRCGRAVAPRPRARPRVASRTAARGAAAERTAARTRDANGARRHP